MNNFIIIYPKDSDYPKVTKEDLQKADYISIVINASNIEGATEQFEMIYKLIVNYPELVYNKLSLVINDTVLTDISEDNMLILQNLKVFVQVTKTEDLEETLINAIILNAMLILPKEFLNNNYSNFTILMLKGMNIGKHIISRLPASAKKLSF